jgi:hypothetical protein
VRNAPELLTHSVTFLVEHGGELPRQARDKRKGNSKHSKHMDGGPHSVILMETNHLLELPLHIAIRHAHRRSSKIARGNSRGGGSSRGSRGSQRGARDEGRGMRRTGQCWPIQVRKLISFAPFLSLKTIILPRQARDKHRESAEKGEVRFLTVERRWRGLPRAALAGWLAALPAGAAWWWAQRRWPVLARRSDDALDEVYAERSSHTSGGERRLA